MGVGRRMGAAQYYEKQEESMAGFIISFHYFIIEAMLVLLRPPQLGTLIIFFSDCLLLFFHALPHPELVSSFLLPLVVACFCVVPPSSSHVMGARVTTACAPPRAFVSSHCAYCASSTKEWWKPVVP